MPVGSDRPSSPTLPHTWRPFGARMVSAVGACTLIGTVAFLWLQLPGDVRGRFSLFQRITLLLVFGAMVVVLYALFRTRARADVDGLTVVNGYHRHRLEWAEIVRLSFGRSRAWALLDLADGGTLAVMAIQNADGDRGLRFARELADVISDLSEPP